MSSPLRFEPQSVQKLFEPVGALTIYWGLLEAAINANIAIIFQAAGGKHIEGELPLMLSRRLKFLRRCFKTIEALAPFREEGLRLIDGVSAVSTLREVLAHGSIKERFGNDGFVFVTTRPNAEKQRHHLREHVVRMRDFQRGVTEALALANGFSSLAERLLQTFVSEQPNAEVPSGLGG